MRTLRGITFIWWLILFGIKLIINLNISLLRESLFCFFDWMGIIWGLVSLAHILWHHWTVLCLLFNSGGTSRPSWACSYPTLRPHADREGLPLENRLSGRKTWAIFKISPKSRILDPQMPSYLLYPSLPHFFKLLLVSDPGSQFLVPLEPSLDLSLQLHGHSFIFLWLFLQKLHILN